MSLDSTKYPRITRLEVTGDGIYSSGYNVHITIKQSDDELFTIDKNFGVQRYAAMIKYVQDILSKYST